MDCICCNGSGEVIDLLGDLTGCYDCGGHGVQPGSAVAYFWQSSHGRQRIAQVAPEGGSYRITWYDQDGPSSDTLTDYPLRELRKNCGWRKSLVAIRLLDHWATTERWQHGTRKLLYVSLWNSLDSHTAVQVTSGLTDLEEGIAALQQALADKRREQ